jgi:hypothetical protein
LGALKTRLLSYAGHKRRAGGEHVMPALQEPSSEQVKTRIEVLTTWKRCLFYVVRALALV